MANFKQKAKISYTPAPFVPLTGPVPQAEDYRSFGRNVSAVDSPEEKILWLRVDYSKKPWVSSTGKASLYASSRGNQEIGEDGLKAGINVFGPLN